MAKVAKRFFWELDVTLYLFHLMLWPNKNLKTFNNIAIDPRKHHGMKYDEIHASSRSPLDVLNIVFCTFRRLFNHRELFIVIFLNSKALQCCFDFLGRSSLYDSRFF